jgi:hypothetical protein
VDAKGEQGSFGAALKVILEKEGVAGLFAGLNSGLFGIGVTNGTRADDGRNVRGLLLLV